MRDLRVPRQASVLQADRRRSELIEAALRLFAERGFRSTTIGDIASATGTAHGLVYHYFRSKDDLLQAVLDRYTFLPRLADASRSLPGSAGRGGPVRDCGRPVGGASGASRDPPPRHR